MDAEGAPRHPASGSPAARQPHHPGGGIHIPSTPLNPSMQLSGTTTGARMFLHAIRQYPSSFYLRGRRGLQLEPSPLSTPRTVQSAGFYERKMWLFFYFRNYRCFLKLWIECWGYTELKGWVFWRGSANTPLVMFDSWNTIWVIDNFFSRKFRIAEYWKVSPAFDVPKGWSL